MIGRRNVAAAGHEGFHEGSMRSAAIMIVVALLGCDEDASAPTEEGAPTPQASPPVTASALPPAAPPTCSGCSGLERCESGRCVPNCPSGEIFVPSTGAKGFLMGAEGDASGKPHRVVLTRPFCMDATEVTVAAYAECVAATKCEEPRQWGLYSTYPKQVDHPVNKVHWKHSKAYCEWRGKSLPTEAQWEWAASGGDDRKWAWGNDEPTCEHTDFTAGVLRSGASDDGCHGGGTSAVGAHPAGAHRWPDGSIHDLSGNVWEWCLDNKNDLDGEAETDPLHLDAPEGAHVVRGGGWNRSAAGIRVDYRGGAVVDYQVPALGFRCVRNPK